MRQTIEDEQLSRLCCWRISMSGSHQSYVFSERGCSFRRNHGIPCCLFQLFDFRIKLESDLRYSHQALRSLVASCLRAEP